MSSKEESAEMMIRVYNFIIDEARIQINIYIYIYIYIYYYKLILRLLICFVVFNSKEYSSF